MKTTTLLKDDNNNTHCELQPRLRHLCHPQARRFQEISSGSSIDLELLALRGPPTVRRCLGDAWRHGQLHQLQSEQAILSPLELYFDGELIYQQEITLANIRD